jgi:hypothetical protein
MRYLIALCVVALLLGLAFFGTRLFDSEPQSQPSPHALDQKE